MRNLVFLGPPGAGKGTQAMLIKEKLSIPHISTGDMLREAIAQGTRLGTAANDYIQKGELVPDEVVIGIVKDRLAMSDCANGYILDGFPRTVVQAQALDGFADITAVILIDVDPEKLIARISGRRVCEVCGATYHVSSLTSDMCQCGGKLIQRKDDAEAVVRNRLEVYAKKTRPLVDYYEKKRIIKKVNGDMPVNIVTDSICRQLGELK